MCPAIGLRHLGLDPDLLTTSRFLKLLGLPLIEGFPFPNPSPSSCQMPGKGKNVYTAQPPNPRSRLPRSLLFFYPSPQTPRLFDSSQPANRPCLPSAVTEFLSSARIEMTLD